MRANGIERTKQLPNVSWLEGVGEATSCEDSAYDLVTFGSSFNVCDRAAALRETKRILRPGGWFACMWNHRDLDDSIQCTIETEIREHIGGYNYGTRREDQTEAIATSGLFGEIHSIEGRIIHQQTVPDCIEAWRSHATLQRQAGEAFPAIILAIESVLKDLGTDVIEVPYTTRIWTSQLSD